MANKLLSHDTCNNINPNNDNEINITIKGKAFFIVANIIVSLSY